MKQLRSNQSDDNNLQTLIPALTSQHLRQIPIQQKASIWNADLFEINKKQLTSLTMSLSPPRHKESVAQKFRPRLSQLSWFQWYWGRHYISTPTT